MHPEREPVFQSRRSDAYHAALHRLRSRGLVYPCGCTRREISDAGIAGVEGSVYPGTCRAGLPPGREARAWRMRTEGARIEFTDILQGKVCQQLDTQIGDLSCTGPTMSSPTISPARWTTRNRASPT
jgi:glutamyl-Q tRNA(Asp) synthetase